MKIVYVGTMHGEEFQKVHPTTAKENLKIVSLKNGDDAFFPVVYSQYYSDLIIIPAKIVRSGYVKYKGDRYLRKRIDRADITLNSASVNEAIRAVKETGTYRR